MTKTEQIIETYIDRDDGNGNGVDSHRINELRRLAKLNEAYWRECQAWRERCGSKDDIGWRYHTDETTAMFPEANATDAARREAGEL